MHISMLFYRRSVYFGLIVTVCILFVVWSSLSMGVRNFGVVDLWNIMNGNGDSTDQFMLVELRVPRIVAGLLAGMAFGISGETFQSLTHNDLASPDMIGLNAGAALGVVAVLLLIENPFIPLAVGAVLGVVVTALVITLVSWRNGINQTRFVLTGIGVGALLFAIVQYVLLSANVMQVAQAYRWLIGSLNATTACNISALTFLVVSISLLAFRTQPVLALMDMGEGVAQNLGVHVSFWRVLVIGIAISATATAVYICGPVAFVAFASGPITRLVIGRGPAVFLSGLMGAFLLISADFVARTLFSPIQLPVGLITVFVGAPFLIFLITFQLKKQIL